MNNMHTPRLRGMQGIAGLALMAVIAYDLAPASMSGGFVGFDVLFTLAGFLAARSLLARYADDGAPDVRLYLKTSLLKTLRMLWPALAFMVAGSGTLAALAALMGLGGVEGLRVDAPAGLTFAENWTGVVLGGGYPPDLPAGGPRLLGHLWAVALLAQYCLLAPFAVLLLKRLLPQRQSVAVLLALAAVSALLMGVLYKDGIGGSGLTRVLYGTDTHGFGFLIGMALAWAMQRGRSAGGDGRVGLPDGSALVGSERPMGFAADWRLVRDTALPWVSCAALVGLAVLAFQLRADATAFHGGLALAAVLTVPLLLGALDDRSWMLDLFEWRPLALIGKYGYGIYLWHWPLWLIARSAAADLGLRPGWAWVPVCVSLLLTAVMAGVSYRLVQKPFAGPVPDWPLRRPGTIMCGVIAALLVVGLVCAIVVS
ncbi:acyltransferase [Bifidobacterium vespertilionis]|uniref:Acyltransferase n=2 Tax=Bifidobacterium vespertilionis TaxID=2562524 RepID=A0A5J5E693_9BIFI|nr:acyltransferase [Bifidobacterium vespertilionis]KAA8824681.1 acyltransferase [Bifidobacterium vespertilionis]